ncbi:MAG: prolipoprotein diacylglyceryl transferase [Methylicorpusculum sp.]|uniref:prolipoprotein diacylglyceryl transferase n=1 Tax=Methylicorpusculum sp. TaxID=2713644 RepID=UPI0027289C20|nr:prolipoprotein diacylglyceryl transferase [Methylicorpusculum sp.]MDO8843865.1 prolipoprotein diacylglyceryl transferase [Methylicorpusculum sp.]MDO8937783.1 prolipoprotein diacylglyceryl transferase [Methylicorpusculum sp.]MDO9239543.1 prolipoprotein diacylglyceryl transferase [Methylicorpusculum sp.]MDP2180593.1 prolipoprotein diacylglyceryl transferase [Methylicorpusculum sp.]MDP2201936.1 prolipoprotein diacylglyceryl transferase [Methylicorpusculum sp.]
MLNYPAIDPVAISLGPVNIHWYGLMYLIGFAGVWILGKKRAEKPGSPVTPEAIEDLVTYGALGVILGGRLGYILFYNFNEFLNDPSIIYKIWQGGMSFHGGMLGVFIAMWLFARKQQCTMLQLTDIIAPLAPIGLGAGRLGNFINGELWGRTTDVPWAMIFPGGGPLPRHPSQLYEAFLEGIVLFILLWWFTQKPRPVMAPTGLAVMLYGCFRFFVEFFRMPDAHLGYLALDWVTMGQILSTPMILIGGLMVYFAYKRNA